MVTPALPQLAQLLLHFGGGRQVKLAARHEPETIALGTGLQTKRLNPR